MRTMSDILSGAKPSDVFKVMLSNDPSLTNADLSCAFKDEFVSIASEALQSIWNWRRPGKIQGINDDRLNEILLHYLREANYL